MAGAAGPYVNCAPRSEWIIAPDFGELFDLISNGTGSFALSGISVTETREERFDFVKPYYGSSGVKLWVLPGEENQVSSINGTKVCIMPGYYLSEALDHLVSLQKDGLVELENDQISVTNSGRLLIRNIAMKFDAHLMKKEKDKPQFSRTV